MESKILVALILSNVFTNKLVDAFIELDRNKGNTAFDPNLYEEALDPELCQEQLAYIADNTLLSFEFLDAGLRIPRSILAGNTLDLGNYHQCLGIVQEADDSTIEGKYCTINIPLNQDFPEVPAWPDIPVWPDFKLNKLVMSEEIAKQLQEYNAVRASLRALVGEENGNLRSIPDGLASVEFTLAVCIPKTCTTQQGLDALLFNITALGFQYEDNFCRFKNDKPWVPADYVAIAIFSIIGLLTILSTSYDLWNTFVLNTDPKKASNVLRSFSVYTNSRRLTTFASSPGVLECVDGIRALAMAWIIIGHTFLTLPPFINALEALEWTFSLSSVWITSAPISVDTFFMLSGLLLVYTTAGKLTSLKLLRNLHLFYLNRLLRMFPLLAAVILVQASIFHRVADGPLWGVVARDTNNCRNSWWTNFLYIQNLLSSGRCLGHSWYLAIDIQLHIISPLVLFWVLSSNKKAPWIALTAGLLSFLTAATIYNFIKEFPGGLITAARPSEAGFYANYYYFNTLTRAAPFFVGMIYGYVMHLWRNRKVEMSKRSAILVWLCVLTLFLAVLYAGEPVKDVNWDNQTVDSFVNSFKRPIWAGCLGWLIFACALGYGGPINWLLSLRMWKLISRISYGMYLFHFPIMNVITGTALAPIFYSTSSTVYIFLSQFAITFVVAFIMTLIVDSPFSTLIKLLLGGGPNNQEKEKKEKPLNVKNNDVSDVNETDIEKEKSALKL